MSGKILNQNIKFFVTASKFQQWLEQNHNKVKELWVGFHKKHSGKKSITYPEALDEALSYGWIDGVRDETRMRRLDQLINDTEKVSVGARLRAERKPSAAYSFISLLSGLY